MLNNLMKYARRTTILKMSALVVSLVAMSFSGCKSGKSATGEKVVTAPTAAPEWVGTRPHNGAYYIGIGTCSKISQPLDYQTIAKKNALNDLASEISVRVQGETFLNSLEVNKNFSEEFISTISTTTDEKIENFEVAGSWENDKEYWTYYRLSKSEYQRQKQEKKNKALSAAYDYYIKATTAEEVANIPAAFDLYMHGLFAMKEFWNEVNEYSTAEGKVYLDNEIYSGLQRITSELMIKPSAAKVVLSSENKYNVDMPIAVSYNNKPVRGITVVYSYVRDNFMKPKNLLTADDGKVIVNVSDVSSTEKSNRLDLKVNIEPLLATDLDKMIQLGLIKNMKPDNKQVPIELITPSFYVVSEEKTYGNPSSAAILASALNSELTKKGMRISNSAGENDYQVSVTSNTTAGGNAQGFVVAYLEMTIKVKSNRTGDIVFQESLGSLKGLQLNAESASMEAYKRGKEKIEQQIVKSILDAIL
jgi:hypothetical protein